MAPSMTSIANWEHLGYAPSATAAAAQPPAPPAAGNEEKAVGNQRDRPR